MFFYVFLLYKLGSIAFVVFLVFVWPPDDRALGHLLVSRLWSSLVRQPSISTHLRKTGRLERTQRCLAELQEPGGFQDVASTLDKIWLLAHICPLSFWKGMEKCWKLISLNSIVQLCELSMSPYPMIQGQDYQRGAVRLVGPASKLGFPRLCWNNFEKMKPGRKHKRLAKSWCKQLLELRNS